SAPAAVSPRSRATAVRGTEPSSRRSGSPQLGHVTSVLLAWQSQRGQGTRAEAISGSSRSSPPRSSFFAYPSCMAEARGSQGEARTGGSQGEARTGGSQGGARTGDSQGGARTGGSQGGARTGGSQGGARTGGSPRDQRPGDEDAPRPIFAVW